MATTIVRVTSTETEKERCCYEASSRNKKGVLREEGVAKVGTQINWEGECCALHSAQLNRINIAGQKKTYRWRGGKLISSIAMNICKDLK